MPFFKPTRRVNLALQGGGAHGAFTWGVLDRLLEDEGIELGWVSGTSAGAVNAVALASGLAVGGPGAGGRKEARATLHRVWEAVVSAGVSDLVRLNPFLYGLTRGGGLAQMGSMMSPYDFNPLGFDPFRKLLVANIDFERLRADKGRSMELLIAATDAGTGRPRLFRRHELSVEAVLASACLPQIHHAVQIEGRAYWDGGFSANPDIVTLATESPTEDTLIVQLNPLDRPLPPRTARDIAAQVNTITFNQPLYRDIEAIVAAQDEHRGGGWFRPRGGRGPRLGRHRFHLIDAGRHTATLSAESKGSPERAMLEQLFRAGRTETARWLDKYRGEIGKRQSVDLNAFYLVRERPKYKPLPEIEDDPQGDGPTHPLEAQPAQAEAGMAQPGSKI
jgi:NTE family protein